MIKEFQGEYRWLSNFYPVTIVYRGLTFASVEHGYVYFKTLDHDVRKACLDPNIKANQIKRLGKYCDIVNDWDSIKYDLMFDLVSLKFRVPEFRKLLLSTKNDYIREGNMWHDKFWGYCLKSRQGENHLGEIIMKVRENVKHTTL